ncbi:TULIP family P47-like protein [Litorivita sp. NS0012-18]|uniref:TULIP family P47-like protein n=1 Tax=Litorivita sp. NS0012-18 TaxID=3127655 RepID=UPI0031020DD4
MSDQLDTHNWSMVAAVTYDEVNAAIAAQASSPTQLQITDTDKEGNTTILDATCGPWTLTTGGAGQNLMIHVPITGGTITFLGKEYDLSPASTIFKVYAKFFDHTPDQTAGKKNLRVTATQESTGDRSSATEPAPAQPSGMAQAMLGLMLNNWVLKNIEEFGNVFAVVDLEAQFAKYKNLGWMRPWYIGYACAEPSETPTTANSVFGVLALIDEPPTEAQKQAMIQKTTYSVDLQAIPNGADGGLVLAPEVFLKHMMLPAVPYMFQTVEDAKDVPTSDFVIFNDGRSIQNLKKIKMQGMQLDPIGKDGKPDKKNPTTVYPTVPKKAFNLEVDGQYLSITANDITFSGGPGITVKLNYHGQLTISLQETTDPLGKKVKALQLNDYTNNTDGSVETAKWVNIVNIVGGVVSLVGAIVGFGASRIVKAASGAVNAATSATVDTTIAVTDDVSLTSEATISCCRGIFKGSVASITELGARFAVISKVAAAAAFVGGTVTGILWILKGVAGLNSKTQFDMADFIEDGLFEALTFPNGGAYKLTSAQLKGVLLMGLENTNKKG